MSELLEAQRNPNTRSNLTWAKWYPYRQDESALPIVEAALSPVTLPVPTMQQRQLIAVQYRSTYSGETTVSRTHLGCTYSSRIGVVPLGTGLILL